MTAVLGSRIRAALLRGATISTHLIVLLVVQAALLQLLELLDGDLRIADGISVHHLGGHSPGMQVVLLETDAGRVCIPGDLVPFYKNLELNWPMGAFFDVRASRGIGDVRTASDFGRSVNFPGYRAYRPTFVASHDLDPPSSHDHDPGVPKPARS